MGALIYDLSYYREHQKKGIGLASRDLSTPVCVSERSEPVVVESAPSFVKKVREFRSEVQLRKRLSFSFQMCLDA